MEHNFKNLSAVLSRCSAQVTEQVIAEVRSAIREANNGSTLPESYLSKMHVRLRRAKAEKAAERRAKAAERRAAKKAAKEAEKAAKEAEKAAKEAEKAAKEAISNESCGEAEAELPSTCSSTLGAAPCTAFTDKMVKYLRQCPAQQMLAVLNSYVHLLFTGNLIHTDPDRRFLENFIYLARLEGVIHNDQDPTAEQAAAFLFDNPALPLPRAQRRAIERLRRKQLRRHTSSI